MMRALSVRQPWALLIAEGVKVVEFRGWRPSRQFWNTRIAIHAAIFKPTPREIHQLNDSMCRDEVPGMADVNRAIELLAAAEMYPDAMARGVVLCSALMGEPEHFGEHPGTGATWGLPLSDVRKLPTPVPARGFHNFWRWEGEA